MALAGQFRRRPQDLAHLSLPPEVPVESSKCYSAAHSIFTSASMAGSDCHFQIITISRTQLQDLFIGIISAAIFTLKWKGLVLWTGGNFTLLTHLRIFLFGCALCGYISIWMTLMFFRQWKFLKKWWSKKKKVQVGTEVKPSWEHLTNDPPRPFLPGNLEEVFTISCLCIQAMQTSKNKSHERERRNIDCFDNCFAIAKETAPLVTMVSTSVLFYLQSSHRHHHGKNINTITKKSKHFRRGKTKKCKVSINLFTKKFRKILLWCQLWLCLAYLRCAP